jgi:hypothetical protein
MPPVDWKVAEKIAASLLPAAHRQHDLLSEDPTRAAA